MPSMVCFLGAGAATGCGAGSDRIWIGRFDTTSARPRCVPSMRMGSLHFLHLMRTFRPWTFASGTEYRDEQLRHWTFITSVAKRTDWRAICQNRLTWSRVHANSGYGSYPFEMWVVFGGPRTTRGDCREAPTSGPVVATRVPRLESLVW